MKKNKSLRKPMGHDSHPSYSKREFQKRSRVERMAGKNSNG